MLSCVVGSCFRSFICCTIVLWLLLLFLVGGVGYVLICLVLVLCLDFVLVAVNGCHMIVLVGCLCCRVAVSGVCY